jgi:hypothetical protein
MQNKIVHDLDFDHHSMSLWLCRKPPVLPLMSKSQRDGNLSNVVRSLHAVALCHFGANVAQATGIYQDISAFFHFVSSNGLCNNSGAAIANAAHCSPLQPSEPLMFQ